MLLWTSGWSQTSLIGCPPLYVAFVDSRPAKQSIRVRRDPAITNTALASSVNKPSYRTHLATTDSPASFCCLECHDYCQDHNIYHHAYEGLDQIGSALCGHITQVISSYPEPASFSNVARIRLRTRGYTRQCSSSPDKRHLPRCPEEYGLSPEADRQLAQDSRDMLLRANTTKQEGRAARRKF
jgi:Pyruvate/2-oxoacid:ferredoxin oxidoreductase delta subunit